MRGALAGDEFWVEWCARGWRRAGVPVPAARGPGIRFCPHAAPSPGRGGRGGDRHLPPGVPVRSGAAGAGKLEAWLLRIARNLCLDRLRRPRLLTLPLEDLGDASRLLAPSDQMDRTALRFVVEQALDQLPEECRTVLILRDVQGLPARDAAEIIGGRRRRLSSCTSGLAGRCATRCTRWVRKGKGHELRDVQDLLRQLPRWRAVEMLAARRPQAPPRVRGLQR